MHLPITVFRFHRPRNDHSSQSGSRPSTNDCQTLFKWPKGRFGTACSGSSTCSSASISSLLSFSSKSDVDTVNPGSSSGKVQGTDLSTFDVQNFSLCQGKLSSMLTNNGHSGTNTKAITSGYRNMFATRCFQVTFGSRIAKTFPGAPKMAKPFRYLTPN